ncbi:MAG: HupE/UreJ family protein [Pseudomonadales bacterium]|nr:HupE/UreJ family protein [Pseudomonadales bacterium]
MTRFLVLGLLCGLALAGSGAARGHEIPGRADVELRVADQAEVIGVAVRVPLGALRDLSLPLRADGTLVIEEAEGPLREAAGLWIGDYLAAEAGGRALPPPTLRAVRASLPSERGFADHAAAVAHVTGPALSAEARLRPAQAHLDALFEIPVPEALRARARTLEPRLSHLGITTRIDLAVRTLDGELRRLEVEGSPGPLPLDPGVGWVAGTFVVSGIEHILGGFDHLLFLVCLVLPLLAWRPLVVMVTAFTAGHTVTLVAASLGWAPRGAWFPALMEALIAASVVWLAVANLYRLLGGSTERTADGRWRLAFLFGLVHGFGFAFMLAERLQFAGDQLLLALVSFNVGVELGQLLFLVVAVPLLTMLLARTQRTLTLALVAGLVLHTAWHWLLERAAVFAAYPLAPPAVDLVLLRGTLQAALLAVVAFVLYRLLARLAAALHVGDAPAGAADRGLCTPSGGT